jgi:hypothetical protein
MSYFVIACGRNLGTMDIDSYDLRVTPTGKRTLRRADINHDGLKIRVVASNDTVCTYFQGDSFGIDRDDILVAVFGYCIEYAEEGIRRFDKDSAGRLVSRLSTRNYDISSIDGNYCMFAYIRKLGIVFIFGSYWNMYSFCYTVDDQLIVFSSRSSIVADMTGSTIDGISYLSLVRNLPLPPERTLFSNVINRLPGEAFLIDTRLHTMTSSQCPLPRCRGTEHDVTGTYDKIESVVVDSVSNRGTLVDLTGGQDTRVTAAILSRHPQVLADFGVTFKTVGEEDAPDVIIARKIARLYQWKHLVEPSELAFNYDWDLFEHASVLLDGVSVPNASGVRGIFREMTRRDHYEVLVGSWGCEFLRDHFFLEEYILRCLGVKIDVKRNFGARARPVNNIDMARLSSNHLTIPRHDDIYLTKYTEYWKKSEGSLANRLCDMAAMRTMQRNRSHWAYGVFRRTTLPYVTDRLCSIAWSLSPQTRMFNGFISGLIHGYDSRLSDIPTDRGAYIRPGRMGSLHESVLYYARESRRLMGERIARRSRQKENAIAPLPTGWHDNIKQNSPFYEYPDVGKREKTNGNIRRELLCLLMLECLQKQYPHIRRRMDFSY